MKQSTPRFHAHFLLVHIQWQGGVITTPPLSHLLINDKRKCVFDVELATPEDTGNLSVGKRLHIMDKSIHGFSQLRGFPARDRPAKLRLQD